MIQGEKGFASYTDRGTLKYIGYSPININGWSVAVTAPISDFTDGTVLSIVLTIIMLVVMCAVSRKVANILGNSIGGAVRTCAERLELLAKGDLSTPVTELHTQDETKILEDSTKAIVETQSAIIGDISYLLREIANSRVKEIGEAGRGFAVVADQIGKLAEQSAQSAINTRHMIEASIQEINKGNEATQMTAEHLMQVIQGLEEVVELIASIQEASSTQKLAIEQIKQGVSVISDVVRDNSATAEETSATSEELSAQAQTLQSLVSKFKLDDK